MIEACDHEQLTTKATVDTKALFTSAKLLFVGKKKFETSKFKDFTIHRKILVGEAQRRSRMIMRQSFSAGQLRTVRKIIERGYDEFLNMWENENSQLTNSTSISWELFQILQIIYENHVKSSKMQLVGIPKSFASNSANVIQQQSTTDPEIKTLVIETSQRMSLRDNLQMVIFCLQLPTKQLHFGYFGCLW